MRLRYRPAVENGICLAMITLMAACILAPGLLRDRVPINVKSALAYPPWEEARPAGMAVDSDPGVNTEAQRYYPWYVFLTTVEHPRDILWSPLEFAGQPFLAIWRTRCLSPFSIPFYVTDAPTALRIGIFLKLWVAGCCAFYAARRFGMRPAIAMIPAAAFQLSGPLLVWPALPISDVLPWFPLLIVFAERLALGQYRAWPGGAFVCATMLLGGEPEAFAILMAFAILFFVLRTVVEWRGFSGALAALSALGAALALAIGLASVQIVPFVEFNHYAVESGLPVVRYAPGRFEFAAWVLPFVNADSIEMSAGATVVSHTGLVLALLLPVWLSLRPYAEPRTRFRCEGILIPVLGLNAFAHFWLPLRSSIPFCGTTNPEHLLMANGFVLGLIGAFTADECLRLGAHEIKSTVKRFLLIGPATMGAAIIAVVWPGGQAGLVPGPWWSAVLAAVFAVAAVAILGYNVVNPSQRGLGYALSALVAFDLLVTFAPRIPSTPRELLYPETPFVALLKKTGGRVTGSASLAEWPLAANSVPQIYGSSGVIIKHQNDYKSRTEEDPLLLRRSGSQMLLLKQEDIQGKFAPLRELLRIEQVLPTGAVLFFDTEAKGRAWMAYEARNVERYSPAELNSGAAILVEQGVPPPPLAADKSPGTATILPDESNTKIRIALDGVSKGILVLADAFFPGWKATVDGSPARVLAVDVLYRGVEVPEGAKEVVFEYDPPLVKLGLLVTAISLAVLLVAAVTLLPSTIRAARESTTWVL